MTASLKQTLVDVWRQALVENANVVVLGAERYPVRWTAKRRLRQADSVLNGNELRGVGTEPGNEIPVGRDGSVWQEGDAIPQRGTLSGECG